MKFSFRTTLLTILFILVLSTVVILGQTSRYYSRKSAEDLLARLLDQTMNTVYNRIHRLIDTAEDQTKLNQRLLQDGVLSAEDFPNLVGYWWDAMSCNPELSQVSLTLEDKGQTLIVYRSDKGQLYFHEMRLDPETQAFVGKTYENREQFERGESHGTVLKSFDSRQQHWYVAARSAGRPIWTPTYVFDESAGRFGLAGMTCAGPVYGKDGEFAGVVTADFDVYQLCQYLRKLRGGANGFAFIVELRDDGSRMVVAQPDFKTLLREIRQKQGGMREELVAASKSEDPQVHAFVEHIPSEIERSDDASFVPVGLTTGGVPYVGGYRYVRGADTPEWLICIALPEADIMQHVWRNALFSGLIGIAVLLVALLVSIYVSRQVSRPLEQLAEETEAIARMDVDLRPRVTSIVREVDRLGTSFEEMKTGLRSFQKYVPKDLVRELLKSNDEAVLGGERRTVTIFFSDIVGFTSIAENLAPEELINHLSEYLNALSRHFVDSGGTVDKYIGDAIMAFWNAPQRHPQHAVAACLTALKCQETLKEMRKKWSAAGKPALRNRIGVNTGDVIVGNIGSDARLNYTVIGDAVNLASRLEGLNRYYGTNTIISEMTYQEAMSAVAARPLDLVSVKGKENPVLVYELLGIKGEVDQTVVDLIELASQGLESYRSQNWPQAIRRFEQLLQLSADDAAAKQMIARCQQYQQLSPGDDWDGVCRLNVK